MIPLGHKHNRCREALENAGADVNVLDRYGQLPLMFAVAKGHTQCVNELIKAGADVNIRDQEGRMALMLDVKENHVQCVNQLINAGASVNTPDKDGETPLMLAVNKEDVQCVNKMIKGGADVNMWSHTYSTKRARPLHAATKLGSEECVKLLIDAGANVNDWDGDDITPLISAVKRKNSTMVELLIKERAGVNHHNGKLPLNFAAESGSEECLKLLIDKGADVNAMGQHPFRDNQTALMCAARCGFTSGLNMLLAAGADVNMKDKKYGKPPLNYAAESGIEECLKILIDAGADVNAMGRHSSMSTWLYSVDNQTALMCAVRCGFTNSVNMLLAAGATVNIRNDDGTNALHFAAFFSYCEVVKILLKAGADVNAKNSCGVTALYLASCHGHHGCMDMLLEKGANVNITDEFGHSALHIWWYRNSYKRDMLSPLKNYHQCVKRFLRTGIHINKSARSNLDNALQALLIYQYQTDIPDLTNDMNYKGVAQLLYAAGDSKGSNTFVEIPKWLQYGDLKLELKHICREAIRKHLLKLDHALQHLFGRSS